MPSIALISSDLFLFIPLGLCDIYESQILSGLDPLFDDRNDKAI